MAIRAINSTNIHFKGSVNKTERGNEYSVTHNGRTFGGLLGATSGGVVGKLMADQLKTSGGKRQLITSLNNIKKSLNTFGSVKDPARHTTIAKGAKLLVGIIAATGLLTGAIIGGVLDSHNNTNRAKSADRAAEKIK